MPEEKQETISKSDKSEGRSSSEQSSEGIEKSGKPEGGKRSEQSSEGNQEEWPDIDVAVDVFAPQGESNKSDIKEEAKEEKPKKEAGRTSSKATRKKKETNEEVKEEKISDKTETLADLKEKIKDSDKDNKSKKAEEEVPVKEKTDKNFLVPLDDYVKAGIHLGTKAISPNMRKYVYRRRADGLAVLNTNYIDEKLREAIKFLIKFKPDDVVVTCKRDAGHNAVEKFGEMTGIRVFTKKYPAGIITNIRLPNFFETGCMFICDPWVDRNALNDAVKVNIPVMGVCDANNLTKNINCVIVGNNKAAKSLGIIFYILAREYMKAHNIDKKLPSIEEFAGVPLESEEDRAKEERRRSMEVATSRIEDKMKEIVAKEEAEKANETK